MIKTYFKTALRNIFRNKKYSLISAGGLAIGIAVSLMIFIIILFHSGFDNFHPDNDRIFRVLTEYHHADSKEIFYGKGVPFGLPASIRTALPGIDKLAILYPDHGSQLQVLNADGRSVKKFREPRGVFFTDPSFFEIFNFPLLSGSYQSLKDPDNVLLTKEVAEKYFGDWRHAVGKSIKFNNRYLLKITGILSTIPPNTDFQLKIVIAYGSAFTKDFATSTEWNGTNGDFGCYVRLASNTKPSDFNTELKQYAKKMKAADNKDSQIIQPVNEIHYDSQAGNFSGVGITHQLINALWLIAIFILLIACVNYINLTTAQAANRAREIGVRKVLGSNITQIRSQFLSETLLLVVTAVIVALFVVVISMPFLNRLLDLPLQLNIMGRPIFSLFLIMLVLLVTLLAGFYPAVVLSRITPGQGLKNKILLQGATGISLRRSLVVIQFVIAQALIIGTLIIVKQMNYLVDQPIGFDKDAVVNVPFPSDSSGISKLPYLKTQLSAVAGIRDLSFSSNTPIEDNDDNWSLFYFDHATKQTDFYAIIRLADAGFVATYGLPIIAGRNLEPSDSVKEFLVNETLIKNLGIHRPEDALQKEISFSPQMTGNIVGILKDFNARSFRSGLAPVIVTTMKSGYVEAGIKLSTQKIIPAMQSIERIWTSTFPDYVFESKFLDDKIESFYRQESQLAGLYKIFASIAILLSCLGLYGLASYMVVQRQKEVGIRKVLGATITNIVYLFSKEFIQLIVIAFVLATPLSWYYMQQWMQNFPFRAHIGWWIFVAGGTLSLTLALLTVSSQAVMAALTNPTESLRSE